jgi:hypothetical protein
MKSFNTSARQGAAGVSNDQPVEFELDGQVMTAYPPTSGQLALFLTANNEGGVSSLVAMFDLLAQVIDDDAVELLKDRLGEGMEISVITDIIAFLVEEWSAHPTEPSSGASASRKSTGKESTAKPRSKPARAS